MISNVFSLIIGFVFWIIAARYYTPYDIGIVSVMLSGTYLISMICTFGFPAALMFYLPRDPKNANRIINSCMIISIVASIILSLIWILRIDIWIPKLESSINSIYIMIFIILSVLETINSIMLNVFLAGRKSSYSLVKDTVFNISKMFPIILFTGLGAIGILLSWTIGSILSIIVGFFLLYKLWKYIPTFTVDRIIKNMFVLSAGNYIAGIIGYLPISVLPIIIANLVSTEAAGYFFISMTIANVLNAIPKYIANSLLVESSNVDKFRDNVNTAIRFGIAIVFPGVLLFMILGKYILNLFNTSYADYSLTTLIILSISSIPMLLNNIFNTVRNSQKRVISIIINNLVIAGITITLSIFLLKSMGIEGAAISYLIANTFVAIAIIYSIKNPVEFTLKLYKGLIADFNLIFKKN